MTAINIELTHPFLYTCHDLQGLLLDCNKLSTFSSRLVKQSELFPDRFNPFKYRGDGFELFCEALLKLGSADNRLGIYDYQNCEVDAPGVDGFGIGSNGKPATVQCKFVSKTDTYLTATSGKENLSNFVNQSLLKFNVDKDDTNNMLVLTTSMGLHHYTDTVMFDKKVRCINNHYLRELVDNNYAFWNQFRKLISD